jgi:hypothetical protein
MRELRYARMALNRRASMYTSSMRRCIPIVILAACLSLVGVQLSGLHLHAGAEGLDAALHGTHVHGNVGSSGHTPSQLASAAHQHTHLDGHHGHDHAGDRDVSIIELSGGLSKLLVFLVCFGGGLIFVLQIVYRLRPIPIVTVVKSRRERWRPPLRAPPSVSCS